jgi:GNAT superfamily N-acetyltransferase
MSAPFTIIERLPTPEEYTRLIAAVGFRPRQRDAIDIGLKHSFFSVCAESEGEAIGLGRVIGDGALHLYLTDVVVHPAFQRRGVGTAIVAALTAWVDRVPFPNTIVSLIPTPGLVSFYQRHGYKAQKSHSPAMNKWVNSQKDL